jgi:hypothetical protein
MLACLLAMACVSDPPPTLACKALLHDKQVVTMRSYAHRTADMQLAGGRWQCVWVCVCLWLLPTPAADLIVLPLPVCDVQKDEVRAEVKAMRGR